MSIPARARARSRSRSRSRRRRRGALVVATLLVVVPGLGAYVALEQLVPGEPGARGVAVPTPLASAPAPTPSTTRSVAPATTPTTTPSVAPATTPTTTPEATEPTVEEPEPPRRSEDVGSASSLTVVVNKRRPLDPLEFRPDDLVPVGGASVVMRAEAAAALAELRAAAQRDGSPVGVHSATRSYEEQRRTFEGWVAQLGREGAERASARAGYSEHQTGLAVDVVALGDPCGVMGCFGSTDAGAWVASNAYRFGFVVRYRAEHEAWTGYKAEPWHLRYVGRQVAADVHAAGEPSLEEFFGLEPAPGYVD